MKTALLLVDLQADYLSVPALAPSAAAVVARATQLLAGARRLGLPVFHAWTTVHREPDDRMPHWRESGRWQCVEGTAGHQPPSTLRPLPGETVVHKRHFSAFEDPRLASELARLGCTELVIAGIHLHACVRSAALDASARGLRVIVADDAVTSDDPVHAAITRRYLADRAFLFRNVSGILDALSAGGALSVPDAASTGAIDAAVRSARDAGSAWARRLEEERAVILSRLAAHIETDTGWAEDITRETGKPIRHARTEVRITAAQLRAVAARAEQAASPDSPARPHARRVPQGVITLVTPWNNPLFIPLGKLAPALLHGNTVVWKPAPAGDAVARRVLAALEACGLPEGVLRLVSGGVSETRQLLRHPGIDAVTLTGGTEAGAAAAEACLRSGIPLQAELGGNNAAVVWDANDLPAVAAAVVEGAFALAGQRCTANRRVIVPREQLPVFVPLLLQAAAALRDGDPFDPETCIGPLVSSEARDRVASLLEDAVARGLDVRRTGPHPASPAPHLAPALVIDPPGSDPMVQEESFGPILVVQAASDWPEALRLCNGVRQGLAAALFTRSEALWEEFQQGVRAGILKRNQSTAGAAVDLPFGGWKSSGIGPAEHGESDREFFTRVQAVYP